MSQLTNPYHQDSAFTRDQPASLSPFPFAEPTSEPGKEAARLHKAAQDATARLSKVRDARTEAASKLTAARHAHQAEIVRGAQEGIDQAREHALSLELAAAEHAANPETHMLRQRTTVTAQRQSVQAYNVFVWDNVIDLLDGELRDEAEAASAELVKALESIAPARERYAAIQNRAYELVRTTATGPHAQELAHILALGQEPAPPLPSDEALETWQRLTSDASELVTLD